MLFMSFMVNPTPAFKIIDPLQAGLEKLPASRPALWFFVAMAVMLFGTANLPWHLDDYDQAKQAYVAYEIANGGDFWFQQTPRGRTATKPPLAGWLSLPIYWTTGSWNIAWRLPGFLSAVVLLILLAREGARLWPAGGASLVAAAFAVNMLTPRLATLVRTDMMLALWITLCGLLILRKVRCGESWSKGEQWAFFGAMLAALFTKGPILYAFLLPGMVAFAFLGPPGGRRLVWSGWWPWVVPLLLFLAWGVCGLLTNKDFYEEVVVREFFSRFDQSLKPSERQQPVWFYFPHLLHKMLPWSLLLLGLPLCSDNVRKSLRTRPEVLWLACWALGGLVLMTLIPSKRVDRIYPVVPPLCLLLAAMVSACQCGERVRRWCGTAMIASVLFWGPYFIGFVWIGYRDGRDGLVHFGRRVQALTAGKQIGFVQGRDEGMVMYLGLSEAISPGAAVRRWNAGELDALVLSEKRLKEARDEFSGDFPPPRSSVQLRKEGEKYLLLIRSEEHWQ